MKIWLTTDTHFGHTDKMIEFCQRPADYEDKILTYFSKVLNPHHKLDNVLVHLGDVCIGSDEKWHGEIMAHTQGVKKWLIRGNHDKKSNNWYITHGWDFIGDMMVLEHLGKKICFSHKPVADFGYDVNIHGHFHNSDHHNHEPELQAIKNDKQRLLAIEYINYQPITLETFLK